MKERDNFPEEKRVACIECGTFVRIMVRPGNDLSGFLCQKCAGGDVLEDAEW